MYSTWTIYLGVELGLDENRVSLLRACTSFAALARREDLDRLIIFYPNKLVAFVRKVYMSLQLLKFCILNTFYLCTHAC